MNPKWVQDLSKYRLTYEGGITFVNEYLQRFSSRETDDDFTVRKSFTYCPAHSKLAVREVINAIAERLSDVTRVGGDSSYQRAVYGQNTGVSNGDSMNTYIASTILPELLVASQVAVFVDRDPNPGITKADQSKSSPYLYHYVLEDIDAYSKDRDGSLRAIRLKRSYPVVDDAGLATTKDEYETLTLVRVPGGVQVTRQQGESIDESFLNLPMIPVAIFELPESLLTDIADYQIALLNLASSDLSYAIKSNFPIFTQQVSGKDNIFAKQSSDGAAPAASGTRTVAAGASTGIAYPPAAERPGFIHPSPEPMQVSMEKQEQLKREIRQLLSMALTNLAPQRSSSDSKDKDQQGLEAGLSFIGAVLEKGERHIAEIWAAYVGDKPAVVSYPSKYTLKTDEERHKEADSSITLAAKIPSISYQKEAAKHAARLTIGTRISTEQMTKIESEIDKAEVVVIDPEVIRSDHEAGFVSTETASTARLYPAGEVEQAKKDHAERAARIALAQSEAGARGVADMSTNDNAGEDEKKTSQSADTDTDGKKRVRK
jgi:hypothetical protein